MNIIFIFILIISYLLLTYKNNKESINVFPSDINITFYENKPKLQNSSDIIITKNKLNNTHYFTHSNNFIYIHESLRDNYKNNYRYKNNLYHNDFRWKYVGIFIVKDFDDYSREWLRNNLRCGPFLYKIIYIYSDKLNKYNKKLFPFIDFGATLVIYGLKPYYRYQINKCVILSYRKLNYKYDFKCTPKDPYLKLYMDKFNMNCILKDNNKIIDSFMLNTTIDKLIDNKKDININNIKWIWKGIPPVKTYFSKWYDSTFDEWYNLIFYKIKLKLKNSNIKLEYNQLPINYMNFLYLFHRNNINNMTDDNIVSQIIQDMNLPSNKILK